MEQLLQRLTGQEHTPHRIDIVIEPRLIEGDAPAGAFRFLRFLRRPCCLSKRVRLSSPTTLANVGSISTDTGEASLNRSGLFPFWFIRITSRTRSTGSATRFACDPGSVANHIVRSRISLFTRK